MSRKVLGIEGTAWSLSAAIAGHDKVYAEAGHPYVPETGGIHPMVAAQHHASYIGPVIRQVLDSGVEFDGVAFSQGRGWDRASVRWLRRRGRCRWLTMCP
jgi:tRNA A37 threonylcarbamoyltransferase TsaD